MGKLPEYPQHIRERAVKLVLEEDYSYAQAAEQLKEEFKDTEGIEKISKSTVYRWVRKHKKKEEKEKQPEPVEEKPEEKLEEKPQEPEEKPEEPPKESVEDISKELKELPKTTPEKVVQELNASITPVPEGPLMKGEEEIEEEEEEEKSKKLADRLMENRSKLLWSITLTLVVTAIAILIYRWWTRRKQKEVVYYQTPQKVEQPKKEPSEKYRQITSPDEFEESDEGYADVEVLP